MTLEALSTLKRKNSLSEWNHQVSNIISADFPERNVKIFLDSFPPLGKTSKHSSFLPHRTASRSRPAAAAEAGAAIGRCDDSITVARKKAHARVYLMRRERERERRGGELLCADT